MAARRLVEPSEGQGSLFDLEPFGSDLPQEPLKSGARLGDDYVERRSLAWDDLGLRERDPEIDEMLEDQARRRRVGALSPAQAARNGRWIHELKGLLPSTPPSPAEVHLAEVAARRKQRELLDGAVALAVS